MPKRSYSAAGSYRYGFNGKENDNDVKGLGNQQDYGMRVYDARVGRFLSVDPMARSYVMDNPYGYAGNSPIHFTDFNGLFKISPYFVKRYPTLARVLEYYLPLLKDNPQVKEAWITTVGGFSSYAEGEKAFDEMVTFGNGPWISPTRMNMKNFTAQLSRFIEPTHLGEFSELSYQENLSISLYQLNKLETALKNGDAKLIGQEMFIVSVVIMHEAAHWGKWNYNCCEPDGNVRYEKGSVFETEAFGFRFSNRNNVKGPFDYDLAREYYNKELGRYGSPTFGLSINIGNGGITNYWRNIKWGNLSNGQLGDKTVTDSGEKEESPAKTPSKPYQPSPGRKSSDKKFTYDD